MPATPDWHPTRYLASLYSPPSERPVLDALFGIESEIVASLQGGLDHNVAHVRLQWWREECERVSKGTPAHPLSRTLVAAFTGTTKLAGLSGFVDVAVWDLASATFENRHELTAYCERWAAAMMVPAAAHAAPSEHGDRIWLALGSTMHEIEMLVNLASEAHSGRLRLPLDEIERAGAGPDGLAITPWPASIASILSERHRILRSLLADSVRSIDRGDQAALRGLLVWAALAWRRSEQAQAALPNPRVPRRFDSLAEGWLAWRAARLSMAGNFAFT